MDSNSWKNFLIAVDDSEVAMEAVRYVGRAVGTVEGVSLCLLNVYPEPPPYYFQQGNSLADYVQEKEAVAEKLFTQAREILAEFNLPLDAVTTVCRISEKETPSKAILRVQEEGGYGTVVLGKRGISKAEEFLFGSISNTVVRSSSGFTVWVVS